ALPISVTSLLVGSACKGFPTTFVSRVTFSVMSIRTHNLTARLVLGLDMTVTKSSKVARHASDTARQQNKKHRPTSRAWLIVALLVIFQISAFADKAVLGLVGPYAMAALGLNATQFGFIGRAFFFLYAIVSVVTGILASK